jgi:anti-sigma B factor antagonist
LWRLIIPPPPDALVHEHTCHPQELIEESVDMTIKEKMHGDVAVLSFKGNLMGEPDSTDVREKIYSLLQEGITKIVLDLGQVKWVNSSGLGTLIAAMTSVKTKGGEMRMARVTDKVESLFAITQLIKVFKTYETVERAVASFK